MVKYRLLSEGCFILAITWEKYSNCHLNYGLAAVYKKHYRKKKKEHSKSALHAKSIHSNFLKRGLLPKF